MKYLLDKEEYESLIEGNKKRDAAEIKELQDFCTLVANEMPVKPDWFDVARPWQCIITSQSEWYCDDCPCRNVCPYTWKHWSK